ncbi:MAG: LysR substrate-binding domain-containing protein, partial [Limisphaerales bacterium]
VILTEAGSGFLPYAQRILNELSSAQRYVSDRSADPTGEVSLGILPTIAPFILQPLITQCAQRYPAIQLTVVEDITDNLMRMVDSGGLDLAIISTCRPGSGAHVEHWTDEPLFAAFPASHPLTRLTSIAWRELRRETVLVLPESNCLARQIQKWCATHRVRQKRIDAVQLSTLLALVSAGRGISLVPKTALKTFGADTGCVFLPFKGVQPRREINLLRNALHYQSKAALSVAHLSRDVLRDAINKHA